jgi:hypothetical protein
VPGRGQRAQQRATDETHADDRHIHAITIGCARSAQETGVSGTGGTRLTVVEPRAPSGLFPSPPRRPTYREPHPVRVGAVLAGAGIAAGWLLVVSLFATSAAGYIWLTLGAAAVAWASGLVLLRHGDRGVAAGMGLSTAIAVAVAMGLVVHEWVTSGWPLW